MSDELDRLQRMLDLKKAAMRQLESDKARLVSEVVALKEVALIRDEMIDALQINMHKISGFARSLLDPEIFGHAVSMEIRNAARRALGLPASETTRLPMQSFNEAAAKRDALTWPRGSLGEDITDGSIK